MTETKEVAPHEWSAALRSGDYEQAFSVLRRDTFCEGFCYCVLGVLADLVNPEGWMEVADYGSPPNAPIQTHEFADRNSDGFPSWFNTSIWGEAVRLNDHNKSTFPEIADWIDEGMPTGDNND